MTYTVKSRMRWAGGALLAVLLAAPTISRAQEGSGRDAPYLDSRPSLLKVLTNTTDVEITNPSNVKYIYNNSVFISPVDPNDVLNSNNLTDNSGANPYASGYFSGNAGASWSGSAGNIGNTTNSPNRGNPAVAIDRDERLYVAYEYNSSGLGSGIAYSTNAGSSWTHVKALDVSGHKLAYPHVWVDNSVASAYEGNVYTAAGDSGWYDIVVARSTNSGATWVNQTSLSVSTGGTHDLDPCIQTGATGKVFMCWTVNDLTSCICPGGSSGVPRAIGFTKSTDGGVTWATPVRPSALDNLDGMSGRKVSMAVSQQNGHIYIVWEEDNQIYYSKSTDDGGTWSTKALINSAGGNQRNAWISVDPVSDAVVVTFMDNRTNSSTYETFVAISYDGGSNWTDFIVSDDDFSPLSVQYYSGLDVRYCNAIPVWSDDRDTDNDLRAFSSAFTIDCPTNLTLGKATIYNDAMYSVSNTLTVDPGPGNQYLIPGTNPGYVLMTAGVKISLKNGFSAKDGCRFTAKIAPCTDLCNKSEFGFGPSKTTTPALPQELVNSAVTGGAELSTSYPNPFGDVTTISFLMPEKGRVSLTVFNTLGHEVAKVIDGDELGTGTQSAQFDASKLEPGIYYYVLTTPAYTTSKKMVVVR